MHHKKKTLFCVTLILFHSATFASSDRIGRNQPRPSTDSASMDGRPLPDPSDLLKDAFEEKPLRLRYVNALIGLAGSQMPNMRGPKEAQIYRNASPSVVMIVTKDSLGSGALISSDGKIITNMHVVAGFQEVAVIFKPSLEGESPAKADIKLAKVIKIDEVSDLALLQVDDLPLNVQPLSFGELSSVPIGSDVHAIGHPTGETWTYTRGIVSQVRRNYEWSTEEQLEHNATVIQTQTPINPGNSGGPLLNDSAELVGINSFKGDGEGLNFAVSVDNVKSFLSQTENRYANRIASPPTEMSAKSNCEITTLANWRSTDPIGNSSSLDFDCDGKSDGVIVVPDTQTEGIMLLVDADLDGKTDTVLIDSDRDNHADFGLYDTNSDGDTDLIGYFKDGDSKPFRYEAYPAN